MPIYRGITSQDLNNKVRELNQRQPTPVERREHRAYARLVESLDKASLKEGHNHFEIIRRIDLIIKGLVKAGILNDDAVIGRQEFFGLSRLERTALNTSMYVLMDPDTEAAIKAWTEDNTSADPDEVYRILLAGSVIACSTGEFLDFASLPLQRLTSRVNTLDVRSRMKVVQSKSTTLNLVSAA